MLSRYLLPSLVCTLGFIGARSEATTSVSGSPPLQETICDGDEPVPISETAYDYIVVGAGASGIVTAQRLVETGKSVLLLERGGASFYSTGGDLVVPWNETTTIYEVPALFLALQSWPGNNAYCNDTPIVSGCVLGGGTVVNSMAYIRPPTFDFDDEFPEGWKWADVASSAERVYERNPGTTLPSMDGKYYDNALYELMAGWFSAAGWTFADSNEKPNAKFRSYGPPAVSVANGRRSGPVASYLPLAMGKPNFTLQLHTKAIRAVRTNSTITGVETEDGEGRRRIVNVKPDGRGKVILAAGSLATPRLLYNSGIGPSAEIETVRSGTTGVTLPPREAWLDRLPVGLIRDHSLYVLTFNVTSEGGLQVMPVSAFVSPSPEHVELFNRAESGPLTQPFMRMNAFTTVSGSAVPDGRDRLVQMTIGSVSDDTVSFVLFLTHNLTSSGRVSIAPGGDAFFSASPYMNTEADKSAVAAAIDELLEISRREGSVLAYDGPGNTTGRSIVDSVPPQPGIHQTGSAVMGARDDGTAVVDTDCKVFGTDNLFVVDASFHPSLSTGNTQAIVMVAAEHAVQRIIALG